MAIHCANEARRDSFFDHYLTLWGHFFKLPQGLSHFRQCMGMCRFGSKNDASLVANVNYDEVATQLLVVYALLSSSYANPQ